MIIRAKLFYYTNCVSRVFKLCLSLRYVLSRQQASLENPMVLYQRRSKKQSVYFFIVTTVSVFQLMMWTYLLISPISEYLLLRKAKKYGLDTPESDRKKRPVTLTDNAYYNKILLLLEKSNSVKWHLGVSLCTMAMGTMFMMTAIIYPKRYISQISLMKAKKMLCFQTYTALGRVQQFEVRLLLFTACCTPSNRSF